MRAVTWHGKRDVRVEEVRDPKIHEPTDAIVRITTTNICGSDLHLYEPLAAVMREGDILGHEAMGIVEEVGADVGDLDIGDRVVVPFQISCGHCWMCNQQLYTQCETTQCRDHGTGAALFGYSTLYGEVAGGQAEYLRVPQAQFTHIKVPDGPADERFVYLSDVLPTAWQAFVYADVPKDGSVVVLGLGPIGEMACRIATHHGVEQVIGVDLVPERLERARERGVMTVNLTEHGDGLSDVIRDLTEGRGPDAVIDAVGLEAHGSPITSALQKLGGFLPRALAEPMLKQAGTDRLHALYSAIDIVRRGGTISLSGVYGGAADPLPMMQLFDKQIQLRMGQANVKRWAADIMPLLSDDDPLGVESFASHTLSLDEAPEAYAKFQAKEDGYFKVLLKP